LWRCGQFSSSLSAGSPESPQILGLQFCRPLRSEVWTWLNRPPEKSRRSQCHLSELETRLRLVHNRACLSTVSRRLVSAHSGSRHSGSRHSGILCVYLVFHKLDCAVQIGSTSNASDMHSAGAEFESRRGQCLSWSGFHGFSQLLLANNGTAPWNRSRNLPFTWFALTDLLSFMLCSPNKPQKRKKLKFLVYEYSCLAYDLFNYVACSSDRSP
jgi:hypothetical protein